MEEMAETPAFSQVMAIEAEEAEVRAQMDPETPEAEEDTGVQITGEAELLLEIPQNQGA